MKQFKRIKKSNGFTLVELIIVIAIIAVLAAIAVPNLLGSVEKSKEATDEANAKLIADAYAVCIAQDGASDTVALESLDPTVSTGAVGLIKGKMSKIPEIKSKKYKGTNSKFAIKVTGGVIEIFGGYVSSGSRVPVYPK